MVKLSVIIPVYNVEKYLERCLNSLIKQSMQDIEFICINDGSTDNSLSILKQFEKSDSRFRIINQENRGVSCARNHGLRVAKGEYVGFIDSDDWVDSEFFEKLYATAKKYDADIAVASIIRLNSLKRKFYVNYESEKYYNNINKIFEICDCPDKNYIWNKIYKLEKLKKNNLYFLEGRVYEDVIFTPKALYFMPSVVTVPDIYYYYWRTPNSIVATKNSANNKDKQQSSIDAELFIKEHGIDVESHCTITKRYKLFNILFLKTRQKGNKKQYLLFNFIKFGKYEV